MKKWHHDKDVTNCRPGLESNSLQFRYESITRRMKAVVDGNRASVTEVKPTASHDSEMFSVFLVAFYATLHPALSVGWSVGLLVTLYFFIIFIF